MPRSYPLYRRIKWYSEPANTQESYALKHRERDYSDHPFIFASGYTINQLFGQVFVTSVKNSRNTLARTDPRNSVG